MQQWLSGLESLHRQVARELEALGTVTLEASCATVRRVTLEHATRASLQVLVGVEIPIARGTYFISVLRIVDPTNPKLIHSQNQTFRGISPTVPDLDPILDGARRILGLAIEREAYATGLGRDTSRSAQGP